MNVEKPLSKPVEVLLVAVPETAGSALYGMLDVLSAAGNVWQTLVRGEAGRKLFRARIVSESDRPFTCGNGIPVHPDCSISDKPSADLVILPEMWLGPDESITGRHPDLIEWLRAQYSAGASLYSACSGAVLLAETGLLDGLSATSHWAYQDLFRKRYPAITHLRPCAEPVFRRQGRAHRDGWRCNVLARSRVTHHLAVREPRGGPPHRQGLSAQMAQRGGFAIRKHRATSAAR
jgi:transcriptional regulator GlxA family with amidase domain